MNKYKIEKILTETLYGDVLLCQTRRTQTRVAIKRIHLESARAHVTVHDGTPVAEDAFIERAIHRRLRRARRGSPNIVDLIQEFEENGYLHFVLNYCERDLYAVINAQGPLPLDQVERYFQQICQGLARLHHRGFAHRDLSLENLLLNAQNECQLTDFGLVIGTSMRSNEKVGKPFYMAPEVAARQIYDPVRADMWSLGVVLFMMLTAQPLVQIPPPDDRCFAFLQRHGLKAMIQLWDLESFVPLHMLHLLERLLCINPEERITMTDLLPQICGRKHPVFQRFFHLFSKFKQKKRC